MNYLMQLMQRSDADIIDFDGDMINFIPVKTIPVPLIEERRSRTKELPSIPDYKPPTEIPFSELKIGRELIDIIREIREHENIKDSSILIDSLGCIIPPKTEKDK